MLAGISADYYLRLERGRDRHPSAQVLEAIARALRLDDAHLAHLLALASDGPRILAPPTEKVPESTARFLAALSAPAFIENRRFDVVASNALARVLSPRLAPGSNQLRDIILDPDEQALLPMWEQMAGCLASSLRHATGSGAADARDLALAEELSATSGFFRALWERHEVREQESAPVRFAHPVVGEVELDRERLRIDGTGLMLVVYHAAPRTESADRLAELARRSQEVRLSA